MRRLYVLLAIASAGSCGGPPPAPPPRAVPVDLEVVEPHPVAETSEYLAQLRSRTAATLQPQIDGQVTEIDVSPGEPVTPGQLLMRINPGRQPAAVTVARANLASREASLRLAETDLKRTRRLFADGAVTKEELDRARATADQARADVDALRAQITSNQVELRYYKIVAPAAGIIGDIPVHVGDRVTPSTALTTVTDNTVLQAYISVPIERAGDVRPGLAVELVDDQGRVIGRGAIRFISPRVEAATQAVLVNADIDNRGGALRADQLVRARIVWREQPGLTVPALAITRMGGQAFVYVARGAPAGLVARLTPVQLGELTNNAYAVTRGLSPGERVITSSVQKLRDGAPVAPAKAAG